MNENVEETSVNVLEKTKIAKGLGRFVQIDLTIKIFGVTIVEWHYPPLADR